MCFPHQVLCRYVAILLSVDSQSRSAILKWLYKPPWYIEVHMFNGMTVWPIYNSLQAFWPGTQVCSYHLSSCASRSRGSLTLK